MTQVLTAARLKTRADKIRALRAIGERFDKDVQEFVNGIVPRGEGGKPLHAEVSMSDAYLVQSLYNCLAEIRVNIQLLEAEILPGIRG